MFLIKIFHFIQGYVILSVSGYNKEELLTALVKNGARLRNTICKDGCIFVEMSAADFFLIRKTHVRARVHVCERHGLPFLARRANKRRGFVVGMIAFLLTFAVGSQFVWTVEYEGVSKENMGMVEKAVRSAGVYEGVPKRNLKTPLEMKNIILAETDGICWAWVYIRGTRATVRVREDVLPPQIIDVNAPCDIIAMRAGIIKRVITERGRCVAEENTAVAPGDVIISGTYEFENEPGYRVHARGTAEAVCEHVRTGVYKQNYCTKIYTGRVRRFAALRIFKWEIPLSFGKIGFADYDAETKYYGADFAGAGLKVTVCREYEVKKEPISAEAAAELAKRGLEREISKELLPPAQLLNSRAETKIIDEETVSVTVTMTFAEQIGTERKINEVDTIEPKTDNNASGN